MASDLYRDVLKDRDVTANNPRTRSTGGVASGDNDYKSYLAGMKPRIKNQNQNDKVHSGSFVDSAVRAQTASHQPRQRNTSNKSGSNEQIDEAKKAEQEKKTRALYAEFSAVPQKKSIEKNYQANDTQKRNNLKSQSNIDFSSLKHSQSDTAGSVGRLRSMFDNPGDGDKVQIKRREDRPRRDRPYSASFDLMDRSKPKVSGIYDRHSMYIQPSLEIDSLVAKKTEPELEYPKESIANDYSEENEIKNQIDINSLLAPEEPKHEKIENENGDKELNRYEIHMDKKIEIDRIKRTQEEVLIEQKFNIKRRSLKDRLSDLASGNETAPTYVSIDSYTPSDKLTADQPSIPEIKPNNILPEKDLSKDKQQASTPLSSEDKQFDKPRKVKALPPLPLKSNNSELSTTSNPEQKDNIQPKDSQSSMSEIDKYKSAVQRFDDFINNQESSAVNGGIKNNQETSNNVVPIDVNQNLLKLKLTEELSRSSDTDYSQSENEADGSDLMNSILNHMEKSKPENKDYFSLLRSSSREEDQQQRKPDESPKPLVSPEAPEVLPRLSKLQGRLPTSPPPPTPNVSDEPPIKELSPSPLPQTSVDYDSRETSCCSGSSECDDIETPPYSLEDFSLPPPPPKSNLSKTRTDKKKHKVIFNDGNMEEVVFTYGPKEYNRANADIDPIASSAEWELEKRVDNMDIFSVDLQKDERGLGLSIIGLGVGTETGVEKLGIFVKTLTENGASQKDGRIQVNDQILEVNGVSLVGVTQFFAAQTLKGTNGVVRFLMGREKSRRTQFAPGAPILDNPDMKKHIEDMNKTMSQLEEYEQRALDAEHTLEEVKVELLKAEERAHEAEYGLKETKELLKAATESPFINGQRKLKNEIKKGGVKKNDKVDDLQRSLKDITNRLSASEENLLALASEKNVKDQELSEFKVKLEERNEHEQKLTSENEALMNEITEHTELLENIKAENDQLKEQLKKMQGKEKEEEAAEKQNVEIVEAEKKPSLEEEYRNKCDELEKANDDLRTQISDFQQRSQDTDKILTELLNSQQELNKIGEIKDKLETSERVIETLKGKNTYLESLVTKLNRSDSYDTGNKENDDLKLQNEKLKEKIVELEAKLSTAEAAASEPRPKIIHLDLENVSSSQDQPELTAKLISPEVPRREQVDLPVNHIIGIKPPLVLRHSKPTTPERKGGSPTSALYSPFSLPLELTVDKPTTSSGTAEVQPSYQNMVLVANVQSEDAPDKISDPNEPNPIPKPPRGQFTSDSEEDFVLVEKPSAPGAPGIVTPEINADVITVSAPTVEPFVDVSKPSPTTPPVIVATPELPEKSPELPSPKLEPVMGKQHVPGIPHIDPHKLIEDKVDTSDEDEGQFQLIQEEIEDEKVSLDNFSPKKNTDMTNNDNAFFDSTTTTSSDEAWLSDEKKRLDKEADMIAEQVALNSPVKRKISPTVSSSSEENETSLNKRINLIETPTTDTDHENDEEGKPKENRSHSIKIDMSYFKESASSGSLDLGGEQKASVIDDVDKSDNSALILKSLSFSAIPDTPTLDMKAAQDKRLLASSRNDSRKPPTKGARGPLAGEVDEFQIKQNSLPRDLKHDVLKAQISGAKSVPNLTSERNVGTGENKHEKHKHKFGFHLPKVFKKNKLAKKNSSGKSSNPSSPSVSSSKLPSTSSIGSSDRSYSPSRSSDTAPSASHGSPAVTLKTPTDDLKINTELQRSVAPPALNAEGSVVPLEQKANTMNQEKVNDAATEEAVVPFAEKLMADNVSSDSPSEVSSSLKSASLNIDTPFHMEVESSESTASPDDIMLEISAPSSRNSSSMEVERKGEQTSVSSNDQPPNNLNGGHFNERPIDIGHSNGHTEEGSIDHWTGRPPSSWDVRQVGLWLVEMDLSQYVNNFKSNDVDGPALLTADGNKLKEYGVNNSEHRAEIKKKTKEFRNKLGKESFNKGKNKDTKRAKDKLQFWKGKYKVAH